MIENVLLIDSSHDLINLQTEDNIERDLEYIVIIHRNGLPIFLKSFADEYSTALKDKYILSGFLSAITNFPKMIGYNNNDLHSLHIGQSELFFSYTVNDIIIILSTKINRTESELQALRIDNILNNLKIYFENEFPNEEWSLISISLNTKLTTKINSILSNYS